MVGKTLVALLQYIGQSWRLDSKECNTPSLSCMYILKGIVMDDIFVVFIKCVDGTFGYSMI